MKFNLAVSKTFFRDDDPQMKDLRELGFEFEPHASGGLYIGPKCNLPQIRFFSLWDLFRFIRKWKSVVISMRHRDGIPTIEIYNYYRE